MNDDIPVTMIHTRKIRLDVKNPRFGHLDLKSDIKKSEELLQSEIEGEPDTIKLFKDIKREGVEDPIRVQETVDGEYVVWEGNRRTTCLKKLLREGITESADGISFEKVRAHVYPASYSKVKIEVLKGRLQTGKKGWGASNISKYISGLRHEHLLDMEDIAIAMQLPVVRVKEHIENWELFKEYALDQNHTDTNQFSYFQEAPKIWEK